MAPAGIGDDGCCRRDEKLRLRPSFGTARRDDRHHRVADRKTVDARADRLDHAGAIPARHPRRGHTLDPALAKRDVGGMHRRGFHGDPNLAVTGRRDVALADADDLRPTRLRDQDR